MNYIQIEPVNISLVITSIKIEVPFLLLNVKCYVKVLCYNANNQLIHTYEFELNKPDYDSWLSDDDLINYVCQKYNFSLINI